MAGRLEPSKDLRQWWNWKRIVSLVPSTYAERMTAKARHSVAKKRAYTVRATWDEEARVWIATSADVPGLCCEAETFEELTEGVLALVPELLVENGLAPKGAQEIPVELVAEHRATVRLVA